VIVLAAIGHSDAARSGLGGGGFMTVRIPPQSPSSSSQVYTIDFRETAPASAHKTMFKDNPKAAQIGGLAVGVPGEVLGLQEAHSRWGSLPWKSLVQPSVELAQGWRVDTELAKRMRVRLSGKAVENCIDSTIPVVPTAHARES
jgi:gamma-glutamyltranspeptidase / glutathione hydrolase / leukotriene-C4 hydrolase